MSRQWRGVTRKQPKPRNVMKIGERYGKLTVTESAGTTASRIKLWLCTCDCGGSKVVRHDHLRNGHTISCGCARRIQKLATDREIGYREQLHLELMEMIRSGMSASEWSRRSGLSTRTYYNYRLRAGAKQEQ